MGCAGVLLTLSRPMHFTSLLMFNPATLCLFAGIICLKVASLTYPCGIAVALNFCWCACSCAGVNCACKCAQVAPIPALMLLPRLRGLLHIVQVGGAGGATGVLPLVGMLLTFKVGVFRGAY